MYLFGLLFAWQATMGNGFLKSLLALGIAWLLSQATAFGQQLNFRWVEFGAGPAMVSLHDNDPRIDRIAKPSFAASAGLLYSLKPNLFITTHAMYELKGGKAVQDGNNPELTPIRYDITSSYLTTVVGVRQYLAGGGVFVEAGPYIAFLLSSSRKFETTAAGARIGRQFTSVDAGGSFSVGYTAARPRYSGFNIRLVNNVGMTDIDLDTGTKEWTNSLALILGMRIQMN